MASAYNCFEAPNFRTDFDPCAVENARVRTAIFWEKSSGEMPKGDGSTPESRAAFFKGLEDTGKAFIFRDTAGDYDGSSTTRGKGRGDVAEKITGKAHAVRYEDSEYIGNEVAYGNLSGRSSLYNFAWITASRVWVVEGTTLTIDPTNPHADDVNAEVIGVITVNWNSRRLPISYEIDRDAIDVRPVAIP